MITGVNGRYRPLSVANDYEFAIQIAIPPRGSRFAATGGYMGDGPFGVGDDVERDFDVDVGVHVQRDRVTADGLDVALGQPDDALVEVGSAGLADRGGDGAGGHRTEQPARVTGGVPRLRGRPP